MLWEIAEKTAGQSTKSVEQFMFIFYISNSNGPLFSVCAPLHCKNIKNKVQSNGGGDYQIFEFHTSFLDLLIHNRICNKVEAI